MTALRKTLIRNVLFTAKQRNIRLNSIFWKLGVKLMKIVMI